MTLDMLVSCAAAALSLRRQLARASLRRLLAGAPIALALVGCEAPPSAPGAHGNDPVDDDAVAEAGDPIIEGSADTDHPGVVWLFDSEGGFSCTGTIVAVSGMTGYVLTAAHCANMKVVAITTDYGECFGGAPGPDCTAIFAVDEQIYYPTWTGELDGNDFSMLRFLGASPTTPIIPAAGSEDGVALSTSTDVVGFGQTESGDNTRRNHKVTPIDSVDAELLGTQDTTCYGDSGGPAIVDGRVVGVTSFGISDSCYGAGFSGRVQLVYDDFIAPYIEQEPVVPACDRCLEIALNTHGGPCGDALEACRESAECAAIEDCQIGCVGNAGCETQCALSHPDATTLHDAIFRCVSCEVCVPSCGEDVRCSQPEPTTSASVSASSGLPIGDASSGPSGDGTGGGGGGDGTGVEDDDSDGCAVATPGAPPSSILFAAGVALGAALLTGRRSRRSFPARS